MSARKRTASNSYTPNSMKNTTVSNAKRTSERNLNITFAETTISDPTQSQKYLQHKLDMAYNKYIQNLALENILNKMHKEAEISYDEQLVYYEEMYESAKDELKFKKDYLEEVTVTMENDFKLKFLENALDDIYSFMNENKTIEKIEQINNNLELICNNLKFENVIFEGTDENYSKLENILKEMSILLQEINEGNDEDFNTLITNIFKAQDFIMKIKKNYDQVKVLQNKLNKLVLKTASFELSKLYENEQHENITPVQQRDKSSETLEVPEK